MVYHERKSPRIPGYDYSRPNYYFITICTDKKDCIFWNNGRLNQLGEIAEYCIIKIPNIYPAVKVDKYVVMPNHVHMILVIEDHETKGVQPDVRQIVGQYKMSVTKIVHETKPMLQIWQRSFMTILLEVTGVI